jgi:hypothetical protein
VPNDLVPDDAIPQLAAQITSPAMLRTLRRVQERDFFPNGPWVDDETAGHLQHLVGLGLVYPAYSGPISGPPSLWVGNHNGRRVVRYFAAAMTAGADDPAPPQAVGTWVP